MEQRKILSVEKTGSISLAKARNAARAAKASRVPAGRAAARKVRSRAAHGKHSAYFGFPPPATAGPPERSGSRNGRRAAKQSVPSKSSRKASKAKR